MQAPHVLCEGAFPCDRHGREQRIEPSVIKALANIAAGRDQHPLVHCRDVVEPLQRSDLDFVLFRLLVGRMARDDEPIRRMTLGSRRRHGVPGLFVTRQHCGHERAVSMDKWPDDATVPFFGPRTRCAPAANSVRRLCPTRSNGPTDYRVAPGGDVVVGPLPHGRQDRTAWHRKGP